MFARLNFAHLLLSKKYEYTHTCHTAFNYGKHKSMYLLILQAKNTYPYVYLIL